MREFPLGSPNSRWVTCTYCLCAGQSQLACFHQLLTPNSTLAFFAAKRRANHMNVWRACSLVLLCAGVTNAKTVAENPSFMMVSGITATEEMCLAVADGACLCIGRVCALVGDPCFRTFPGKVGIEGADVILEPCSVATAAGDGRELWQLSQQCALASRMPNSVAYQKLWASSFPFSTDEPHSIICWLSCCAHAGSTYQMGRL